MEVAPATRGDDGVSARSHQLPAQPRVNGGGGSYGGAELVVDDGGSTGGGFSEDGERNSGGNRWPKQETLALIRIRSEMDAAFRDSNLKGPLWDEVSRKLAELGYHRSAKKCREKFENVYKYHRRTKEGRTSKPDKIYRFSDQLQALESNPRSAGAFPPTPPDAVKPPPVLVTMPNNATIPSLYNPTDSDQNNVSPISVAAPAVIAMPPPPIMNHKRTFPFSQPNISETTNSASSSDTSDDEPPLKKKKWEDFFGKLMKEMIQKQEELHSKFLETLDRRERDRVAKEDAWRAQEIAKMNQEHERLIKERSIVAAKDAAIVTFLQKMTGKNPDSVRLIGDDATERRTDVLAPSEPLTSNIQVFPQQQIHQTPPPPPPPPPPQPPTQQPLREVLLAATPSAVEKNRDGGGSSTGVAGNILSPSPSRWPKAEIHALITLRTQLEVKYQENVPKGPLWEEISALMRNLGYNRNAKRCKEKWENINKYYKKIKEGNKKRTGDSKTCPYFDQLDAIYREKSAPIVAQPEQQWPPAATVLIEKPPPQQHQQQPPTTDALYKDNDNTHMDFTIKTEQQQGVEQETPRQPLSTAEMEGLGSESDDDYDDEDDDEDDDDRDNEGGGYEIVASKMSSMDAV